ncbi:MAG: glycosyltransferase family 2 protein [Rhizobiaceae bacterium]|nr:glycosyltransferase family 2 protein [Rhizobiaceae bacterium]
MAKLSVVAPFFNEQDVAAHFCVLLEKLASDILERFDLQLETVLVDDGSTDASARTFANNLTGDWKIVQLSRNFGKEVAILAGLENATGNLVMLMDADLQHSADTALEMIAAILSDPGIDVVHAVRADGRTGWKRTQAARLFYRLINISQRFDIPENSGDFRIMRRPVVDALVRLRDKRRFNKGLYAWAGFRQRAIPYRPVERAGGATKWSRLNLVALSIEGFTSFSVVPLRIVSGIGLLIALAGMLYGAKIVFEVLFTGVAVPGFPSLIVAVVVLGGFNLALVGLVGEYVWAALSEAKDRPIYLVREVIQPETKVKTTRRPTRRETSH